VSIIILGAGAFAREAYDWCIQSKKEVVGFYATQSKEEKLRGLPIYKIPSSIPKMSTWIVGVGTAKIMKMLAEQVEMVGISPSPPIIHPSCILGSNTKIGLGSIVCPGSTIACDVTIGKSTIIDTGCIITHDCRIGNYVHLSPSTTLAGLTVIKDECNLGLGTRVIPKKSIAKGSITGAGSVIIKDMPSGLHVGIPAVTKRIFK